MIAIATETGALAPRVRMVCARIWNTDWALFAERDDLRERIIAILTEELAKEPRDA